MIQPRQTSIPPPISPTAAPVSSTLVSIWRSSLAPRSDVSNRAGGSLTPPQNRAVLITALSAACVSLLAVIVTLRWFLLMRRSFRHRLVLHLILSDTCKAIWYFVFAIVVFARGPVQSSSGFCQASGFFLAFSIEAADMSIFIIALHSILYIVRPHSAVGEGGLYPYRYWIYPIWLGPPLLAASLAFIHPGGYVTAGTFCYLPPRPIWYRLALSWVPRYLIIGLIIIMYIWIYIYVHIKFRGFDNLGDPDSSFGMDSKKKSALSTLDDVERKGSVQGAQALASPEPALNQNTPLRPVMAMQQPQPWDEINFITSKTMHSAIPETVAEVDETNLTARGSGWSGDTYTPPGASVSRDKATPSESSSSSPLNRPAVDAGPKNETDTSNTSGLSRPLKITSNDHDDPLKQTRLAIRKQLRYLFIYPLVYIFMWSFPFAAHALRYNDYYVLHPIFWLSVVQTLSLSLQAGVDSVLFSWTEKPWRRIAPTKCTIPALHSRSKSYLQRKCGDTEKSTRSNPESIPFPPAPTARWSPHWWEAEGRRRNDSVWMGSGTMADNLSPVVTRVRSKSPEKPEIPKKPTHSRRRRSSGNESAFDASITPGLGRTTLTPVSSNSSSRRARASSHGVRPSSKEDAPREESTE